MTKLEKLHHMMDYLQTDELMVGVGMFKSFSYNKTTGEAQQLEFTDYHNMDDNDPDMVKLDMNNEYVIDTFYRYAKERVDYKIERKLYEEKALAELGFIP